MMHITDRNFATTIVVTFIACLAVAPYAAGDWLGHIGGRGAEVIFDVAETPDRSVCTTGTFWSSAQFGDGEHAVTLSTPEPQDMFVACYAPDGRLRFARNFGAGRSDEPRAIGALPNGDLVITGLFSGRIGLEKAGTLSAQGGADIFVMRMTGTGEVLWSRQFGGKFADGANALATTPDGNILLAGSFEHAMLVPRGNTLTAIDSAGKRDAVVMKLDGDGNVMWATQIGGTGYDEANAISARHDGGVLVAGTFRNTITVAQDTLTSRGFKDVFVTALDAEGLTLWTKHLGGKQQDTVQGIVEDANRIVTVAGDFQNEMTLPDESTLLSAGGTDVYIARFDRSGDFQRATSFGGQYTDQLFALASAHDGGVLLCGHYQGAADVAPGPETVRLPTPSPANSSAFLVELDASGHHRRATMIGGVGMEMALGMSALADGGVAVVGLFNKDLSVSELESLNNRGKTDAFLAHLPSVQE